MDELQYDDGFVTHSIDVIMGKPKSGKTLIAGSYPKPMLYISVGNDGGGRVLKNRDDFDRIKVISLRNDPIVGGKIRYSSIEKLAKTLAILRQPGADEFKTIVIDTVGSLQDDYKVALETAKGGVSLSQPEWGMVSKMMLSIKDNMKRFSEEKNVTFVWVTHTNEMELYETSGLEKEIRIIPDLTIKTGVKYLKDASNIFYACRKTILESSGKKSVKFLTYVGPHPVMDTGTRDMILPVGNFVENFTYDKWQELIKVGELPEISMVSNTQESQEQSNIKEEED